MPWICLRCENLFCQSLKNVAVSTVYQIKSIVYIYSSKTQSHCLSGLYNLCSEQHPLSLHPQFQWGKTCHIDKNKTLFTGGDTDVRNLISLSSFWKIVAEMALRWDKIPKMHANEIILGGLAATGHVCPRLQPLLPPVPAVIFVTDQYKLNQRE